MNRLASVGIVLALVLGIVAIVLAVLALRDDNGDLPIVDDETAGVARDPDELPGEDGGAAGDFSLVMMAHSGESPGGFDVPGSNAWDGEPQTGEEFVYASIPCTGDAPVNNIASDLPSFNTRVPESRVPSSMRAHPLAFTLREADDGWEMDGSIAFTVCQLRPGPTPEDEDVTDEDKPQINVDFTAGFTRFSPEQIQWSGEFELTGGTGRYEDLSGSGQISGYHFCFGEEGCGEEEGGVYRDAQFVMEGEFSDPTPELDTPAARAGEGATEH